MPSGSEILGAHEAGAESGDLISRLEIARNKILLEFANIITDNEAYRSNVVQVIPAIRNVDTISSFPEVGIELGETVFEPKGGTASAWDCVCPVFVQGAVEASASDKQYSEDLMNKLEALRHDFCKIMASIYLKYINNTGERWNVVYKAFKIDKAADLGKNLNKGIVMLQFDIHLQAMDTTFR